MYTVQGIELQKRMKDLARGENQQDSREEKIEEVKAGEYYKIDMNVVKKSRRAAPQYLKLVRKMKQDGEVYVVDVKGKDAVIAGSPMDAMLGTAKVPIDALKESATKQESQSKTTREESMRRVKEEESTFQYLDMDEIVDSYFEAMFWAEEEIWAEMYGEEDLGFSDISQSLRRKTKEDIIRFLSRAEDNGVDFGDLPRTLDGYMLEEMLGHDFYLTRRGTGAGFIDRDYEGSEDILERLASEDFEMFDPPEVGDDGKIYESSPKKKQKKSTRRANKENSTRRTKERIDENVPGALESLLDAMEEINDHTGADLVEAVVIGDTDKAEKVFRRWLKRERQGGLSAKDFD